MIIFEELVYQEALRRKLTVLPQQLKTAEADFKGQFHSAEEYNSYLKMEMGGSEQAIREKIKRSMLIEMVLKSEVEDKSVVTVAEARAFYDKNAKQFLTPETYTFQSVSIMPPQNATPEQKKEALKKAQEALKEAKGTKSYQEFGLLAEKISEDDFRVNMGDHQVKAKLRTDMQKAKYEQQRVALDKRLRASAKVEIL
jgi:hypothetical protein